MGAGRAGSGTGSRVGFCSPGSPRAHPHLSTPQPLSLTQAAARLQDEPGLLTCTREGADLQGGARLGPFAAPFVSAVHVYDVPPCGHQRPFGSPPPRGHLGPRSRRRPGGGRGPPPAEAQAPPLRPSEGPIGCGPGAGLRGGGGPFQHRARRPDRVSSAGLSPVRAVSWTWTLDPGPRTPDPLYAPCSRPGRLCASPMRRLGLPLFALWLQGECQGEGLSPRRGAVPWPSAPRRALEQTQRLGAWKGALSSEPSGDRQKLQKGTREK